jgi:hexosaminidase
MRLHPVASSILTLCLASTAMAQKPAPTCADLHLVPAVRECTAVETMPVGAKAISIRYDQPEDGFAAKDLEESLQGRDVHVTGGLRFGISLVRADSASGKTLLGGHSPAFDQAMHDEGYMLVPDSRVGLAVVAESGAGMFYGVQTVKQLVRGSGKDAVLLAATVRDWPAMAHRGLSDDWSRGPLPNMEFLKREIRTLAEFKYNTFSPYFEHTFAYESTPVAAFPGGAMTPAEARELVEYAAKYHITVIPEQEAFGHLHHVLKFEQYSALAETPHGAVLAPGDPATLPQIGAWFSELAKTFPGPYAHIGADETFELGLGRTREEVTKQGLGAVYLNFLSQIHKQLEPNHKRLLFWGDIAVNSPELVGTLPKDMIAVPWVYDARPDFTKEIVPFTKAGLETWVAPGVNNWNRVYPDNNEALGNIRAFVRDGQRLGATGMLNTVWNDDGEGLFDENWFGVLFGAAAGWQSGESSEDNFAAAYGQAFHGDSSGKISQAQRELMAVHTVLKKAGLEAAQNRYFWVDPYTAEGQRVSTKLLPVAAEVRLHAEKAITLLAEARAASKLENQEPLDAMELGARRIDFIGYKFQAAQECIQLYARAQTLASDKNSWGEVENIIETIGSNNGRIEDMRDGYTQLGELYRQAWLRVNRPYWLANNQARYDRAARLWVDRSERWSLVMQRWWDTHTLPPAAEVGLSMEKVAAGN